MRVDTVSSYNFYDHILLYTATVDCLNFQCPIGSECRVCHTTGLPYCEYSCAIDNGGCGPAARCTEVVIPSPTAEQCQSTEIKCKEDYK